ncbi:hypothetical protein MRX96_047805, partial [Rhipicephalus microplus]
TGSLVKTPEGALEVTKRSYENLYAEPTALSAEFLFVINDQVYEFCDSPIVEEELFAALATMKRNCSPGTDGWNVPEKPFTALVNRLLREGTQ